MKRLLVSLFIVCLFASTALAVDLYDGDGNYIGEVVSKGEIENGMWGVLVFVPDVGKFARVSTTTGELLDQAIPVPWNLWGVKASETIGSWEGFCFASGSEHFRKSDILPLDTSLFAAERCEICDFIFPIKLPLRYEVSN